MQLRAVPGHCHLSFLLQTTSSFFVGLFSISLAGLLMQCYILGATSHPARGMVLLESGELLIE